MLRKYFSSKDNIDIVIVDAEYGKILNDKYSELQDIDDENVTSTIKNEYFKKFHFTGNENTPCFDKEGNMYCTVARWGTVGLVGNEKNEQNIVTKGYDSMLVGDEKNILIFDWYLPNMGVFSLMYLEKKGMRRNPYDLSDSELNEMYEKVMKPLKPKIAQFQANLGLVTNQLYKDEISYVPGIGEWAIGNSILKGNKSKNWFVPKEGVILWIEAIAIPKHVAGKKKEKAMELVRLFAQGELQSKLCWRNAYTSQAPNKTAYKYMDSDQQKIMKLEKIDNIMNNSFFRKVPENVHNWLEKWYEFKK